jgi:hypothetical protein
MPDAPRSWFEFWVRFWFGALFGLVISGFIWLRWFWTIDLAWLGVPSFSLLCAFAAVRYGDSFWSSLRRLAWWWN